MRIFKDHPESNMIGDPQEGVRTRRQLVCGVACYVSMVEPKNIEEALLDDYWIQAMQEELHQFERNNVWELTKPPKQHNVIGTKWIFKNKKNEEGTVVRNKARLVVTPRDPDT